MLGSTQCSKNIGDGPNQMASSLSKEKNCGRIPSLVNRTIKLAQNAPTRLKVFLFGEVGVNFLGSLSLALSLKERERGKQ